MRVCLMIEGQEDVTWDQWRSLAVACEENGFEGLFRSDHYLSVEGRTERGSLDAWTTLGALPKPGQRARLPIVMGGSAKPRGLALAARWADEYNTVFVTPEEAGERRAKWAQAWEDAGRDPDALVFSLMTTVLIGADDAE